MSLTKQRKGEIALEVVKTLARKRGVTLNKETRKELLASAKEMGIPEDEALAFAEEIVRELVEETFA